MDEERKAKLMKFKTEKAVADTVVIPVGEEFLAGLEKQLQELKALFGDGVELNDLDTLLNELQEVGSLKDYVEDLNKSIKDLYIPDIPKEIKIKDLDGLLKALNKLQGKELDLSPIKKVADNLQKLTQKIDQIKVPKQGQEPGDYVPTRRVMLVGKTLMYDDSFYTGSGGGGSNIPLKNGSVPVVNPDGSNIGGSSGGDVQYVDDTAHAAPTGTIALWHDDNDDHVHSASYTWPLPVDLSASGHLPAGSSIIGQVGLTDTGNTQINPAKEDGNLASIKTNTDKIPASPSTTAKQDTGNTSLASIDGKITAVNTGAVVVSSSALPALASTSTKQSDGSQKTQVVDGAGNVIGATSNALDVNVKSNAATNQSVNIAQLAGTTTDTNSGSKSAGTLRVVLATDQPALTNKLLVTPDSVALPANQSVNVSQINGVTPLMGVGASGTGAPRVVQANDAGKTILSAGGSASSSGNNTLIAAGTNKIKVAAFSLTTTSTTAMTCIFQSGASGTELWRVILQAPTGANSGANLSVNFPAYLFATASATLLNLNLSSANAVHWSVSYIDEA